MLQQVQLVGAGDRFGAVADAQLAVSVRDVALDGGQADEEAIDKCQLTVYDFVVIVSFRHKGLNRLYENDDRSKLPPDMVERIRDILALLDAASEPAHLDRPSLKLHPLKGKFQGFWAVTVRANWRIIFRFEDGDAFDIDFLDYH